VEARGLQDALERTRRGGLLALTLRNEPARPTGETKRMRGHPPLVPLRGGDRSRRTGRALPGKRRQRGPLPYKAGNLDYRKLILLLDAALRVGYNDDSSLKIGVGKKAVAALRTRHNVVAFALSGVRMRWGLPQEYSARRLADSASHATPEDGSVGTRLSKKSGFGKPNPNKKRGCIYA